MRPASCSCAMPTLRGRPAPPAPRPRPCTTAAAMRASLGRRERRKVVHGHRVQQLTLSCLRTKELSLDRARQSACPGSLLRPSAAQPPTLASRHATTCWHQQMIASPVVRGAARLSSHAMHQMALCPSVWCPTRVHHKAIARSARPPSPAVAEAPGGRARQVPGRACARSAVCRHSHPATQATHRPKHGGSMVNPPPATGDDDGGLQRLGLNHRRASSSTYITTEMRASRMPREAGCHLQPERESGGPPSLIAHPAGRAGTQ